MRTVPKLLLAGAGVLAVAGAAVAASDRAHVMNVALPDGSIASIWRSIASEMRSNIANGSAANATGIAAGVGATTTWGATSPI